MIICKVWSPEGLHICPVAMGDLRERTLRLPFPYHTAFHHVRKAADPEMWVTLVVQSGQILMSSAHRRHPRLML